MKVAMGSMFRDSMAYLWRTIGQYGDLAKHLDARGDQLRLCLVENDSRDDTWEALNRFGYCGHERVSLVQLSQATDGCPYYPSLDHQPRWQHLAWVANHTLDMVTPTDDVFIYVESDLVWTIDTMLALIDHLHADVRVVSPLNMHTSGRYYDTWGSRKDGVGFSPHPPFHPALDDATGLVEVDSIAGCTAMTADVARTTRFQPQDCYVGWNRDMRAKGHKVWLDPSLSVIHP